MSIPSFLRRKGSIGLLIAINDGCETFTEIKSEMTVSQTTVSKRIGDAEDSGLLDHGKMKTMIARLLCMCLPAVGKQ